MKRFLSLILSLFTVCSVSIFPVNSEGEPTYKYGSYTYTINNGEITITDYSTYPFDPIEVPSEIDGIPVTVIGAEAFKGTRISSITLPNTVNTIQDRAFSESYIESIVLSASIQSIGKEAFKSCSHLTEITIPDNVTSIGDGIFSKSTALKTVNLGKGITKLPDNCFSQCSALTTVTNKAPITELGNYVFKECTKLKSITLDEGLEKIPLGAFSNCKELSEVTIPQSVTTIEASAFWYCSSLENITFSANLQTIGNSAFSGTGLKEIYIPESVSQMGGDVFNNCIFLEKAIFDCTLSGDFQMFMDCTSLLNFAIPEGVNKLNACFLNCKELRTVYIPSSVDFISYGTFSTCKKLTDIYYAGSEKDWNEHLYTDQFNPPFPDTVTIHFNTTREDAFPREYRLMLNDSAYMIPVGETIEIYAPFAIPYGLACFAFDRWSIVHGEVTLENYESNSQYLVMPDHDVVINAEYYLVGDVAQSEAINAMDILSLQNYIKNGASYSKYNDINIDGSMDAFDIISLMSIIKGEYDYAPYVTE